MNKKEKNTKVISLFTMDCIVQSIVKGIKTTTKKKEKIKALAESYIENKLILIN
jgi:hypothetical protein